MASDWVTGKLDRYRVHTATPSTRLRPGLVDTMYERDKLLNRVLRGRSDANIPFAELCRLMRALGFNERIRGSHHIFAAEGVEEILNLQPKGGQAKPYQSPSSPQRDSKVQAGRTGA